MRHSLKARLTLALGRTPTADELATAVDLTTMSDYTHTDAATIVAAIANRWPTGAPRHDTPSSASCKRGRGRGTRLTGLQR